MTDIIAEIAAASREQTAGIEQVNQAVTQMDEVTQQNAALVEQAAAASQAIVEQAHGLIGVIARYNVGESEVPAAKAATPATAAERRAATRPWARNAPANAAAAPRAAGAPGTRRALTGNDADWKEF